MDLAQVFTSLQVQAQETAAAAIATAQTANPPFDSPPAQAAILQLFAVMVAAAIAPTAPAVNAEPSAAASRKRA